MSNPSLAKRVIFVLRARESPLAIHVRQRTALKPTPKMADFCYIPDSAAVLPSEANR